MTEPFWRDEYSFGFYKKNAESKVWQAVCKVCKAEFAEAHICQQRKERDEKVKRLLDEVMKLDEEEIRLFCDLLEFRTSE